MSSVKEAWEKEIMGKLNSENRPIPYWIRIKTNRKVSRNNKSRNWRLRKKVHKVIKSRRDEHD